MASNEDLFRYTSGRWLNDEQRQQALRYQRFNVDALKSVAASSARANGVTDIRKLAEGRCNKVFHIQLTEGAQVIARIPTPLSGRPHLVTASEVATMEFLRNRLGLKQVPRVLSWSSRSEDTPVGAEYIIMDVADGVELHSVWHQLSMKQRLRLVRQWTLFESKVIKAFSGSSGYGSLYYRKDVPAEDARDVSVDGQTDQEFVLGPSTLQTGFWEDRYGSPEDVKLDCGPWSDVPSYLQSITQSERVWIRRFANPPAAGGRSFVAPWEPPSHLQIPQNHLRLLDQYDSIAKYFIPSDERLHRPTFTLRDSNQGNIFLSREALERDGTIEISAVIDWQHTAVLPLYLTALIPRFIEQVEPAPGQAEEDLRKETAYLRKAYHALYQDTGLDVVWASALSFGDKFSMAQQLPSAAQFCWHGGYVKLKRLLIRAATEWDSIVGPEVPCPLGPETFSKEAIAQAEEEERTWMEMEDARESIEKAVGIENDGWVRSEDYDKAVRVNEVLRKAWVESLGKEERHGLGGVDPVEIWPFQGRAESH
ncbi:uncharacterized protein LACBIDRAFT_292455 [Laccaria bicolor S238N-H82]|uniref:Predicted protein n=1 Tax=Laccaria bicolor (strain S238N-H82 / ATCC MYA-4686) TaxID=486041 RepID=B0CXB2_LACBS|nr:uncharacterized protein LACBIDRAFT_292455 [Laccaria bicolor S238N-H82]EDR13224.1 predicted protein [Laccaria bicolor S238N-H82]|eukprot:XP_001875722.1 predicted protein [Laccaria bicolor S238N-H82]